MKTNNKGFSSVELIVAVILFSVATTGILLTNKAMTDHRQASASTNAQNAYSTFQAQVALQGINPALVANPLGAIVGQGASVAAQSSPGVRASAAFEAGAVAQPSLARRVLSGSAVVDALNYTVASAGNQEGRGAGIGFGIETAGPAPGSSPNAIPLAPPVFNITGDLTNATFPLNNIATLPSGNPADTVYRYTTDGSTPTGSSPLWNNDPAWTPDTFPGQVTIQAFNPNPEYSASPAANTTYSMQLNVSYGREDGRSTNLYGFTIADLSAANVTGVVLNENVDGYAILYTLDGSNPLTSQTTAVYGGAFAPPQGQFSPNATLTVVAVSSDNRIVSSAVATYTLSATQTPLSSPTFITSNAQPLNPGDSVVISMNGGTGSPRTAVNNGAPNNSSSNATSFPLN